MSCRLSLTLLFIFIWILLAVHSVWRALHLGRAMSAQVYFEAKVTDEGLCRVGWAARSAGLELGTDKQVPLTTPAGKRVFATEAAKQLSSSVTRLAHSTLLWPYLTALWLPQGFGFGGTGKKSFARSFEDYGQPFGECS